MLSELHKGFMSINYNKKLFSSFLSLSVVQGINFVIPLLVMPFVISKIGTAAFGVIAVAQVLMIYLSTICDYGFNITATRDIAINKEDPVKVSSIFFTVLFTKLILTIFIFLFMLIAALLIPALTEHFQLYIFAFSIVIGQTITVNWIFQGLEKMQFISVCTLLSRLLFLVLIFMFIRERKTQNTFYYFLV